MHLAYRAHSDGPRHFADIPSPHELLSSPLPVLTSSHPYLLRKSPALERARAVYRIEQVLDRKRPYLSPLARRLPSSYQRGRQVLTSAIDLSRTPMESEPLHLHSAAVPAEVITNPEAASHTISTPHRSNLFVDDLVTQEASNRSVILDDMGSTFLKFMMTHVHTTEVILLEHSETLAREELLYHLRELQINILGSVEGTVRAFWETAEEHVRCTLGSSAAGALVSSGLVGSVIADAANKSVTVKLFPYKNLTNEQHQLLKTVCPDALLPMMEEEDLRELLTYAAGAAERDRLATQMVAAQPTNSNDNATDRGVESHDVGNMIIQGIKNELEMPADEPSQKTAQSVGTNEGSQLGREDTISPTNIPNHITEPNADFEALRLGRPTSQEMEDNTHTTVRNDSQPPLSPLHQADPMMTIIEGDTTMSKDDGIPMAESLGVTIPIQPLIDDTDTKGKTRRNGTQMSVRAVVPRRRRPLSAAVAATQTDTVPIPFWARSPKERGVWYSYMARGAKKGQSAEVERSGDEFLEFRDSYIPMRNTFPKPNPPPTPREGAPQRRPLSASLIEAIQVASHAQQEAYHRRCVSPKKYHQSEGTMFDKVPNNLSEESVYDAAIRRQHIYRAGALATKEEAERLSIELQEKSEADALLHSPVCKCLKAHK